MLSPIFERFVDKSPISVMARGMMERALNPEQLDLWFEKTADSQYTRDLLFSSVFDIMSQVVSGSQKSVHAAYQASQEEIAVSVVSLYSKLNGIEVNTSAELVRYAAGAVTPVIEGLKGARRSPLPGYNAKLLDGNCIEATEHRINELRSLSAGALPGKSLVVYDPVLGIPVDVFPCEDGHAQERSLLNAVLATVNKDDLWVADRNFCTVEFTCGIDDKEAFLIFRQHGNLPYTVLGKEKTIGKTETGKVFEQPIMVINHNGEQHRFRRIRVLLRKETRDGDKEIFIITNLPKRSAGARRIAEIYRDRWTIETAFQQLEKWFNSEINTLGYPPAALFAFCVALISYMMISVIMAALCSIHGTKIVEEKVSGYYIADEISGTYRGMIIAISHDEWKEFRLLTQRQFIAILKKLSKNVKLSRFLKHPRGPKKPVVKRKSDPKHPHVSTAKLIASRKR
ncbi:MAG: IS4 family transposase [Candidatus Neomarinimicrobiota bacterium]